MHASHYLFEGILALSIEWERKGEEKYLSSEECKFFNEFLLERRNLVPVNQNNIEHMIGNIFVYLFSLV
jgi:hypothetical protein